jgi:hypothetical protein
MSRSAVVIRTSDWQNKSTDQIKISTFWDKIPDSDFSKVHIASFFRVE